MCTLPFPVLWCQTILIKYLNETNNSFGLSFTPFSVWGSKPAVWTIDRDLHKHMDFHRSVSAETEGSNRLVLVMDVEVSRQPLMWKCGDVQWSPQLDTPPWAIKCVSVSVWFLVLLYICVMSPLRSYPGSKHCVASFRVPIKSLDGL